MTQFPQARFGSAEAPLPDWHEMADGGLDDDEELGETPPDVVAMLGFDPLSAPGASDDDAMTEYTPTDTAADGAIRMEEVRAFFTEASPLAMDEMTIKRARAVTGNVALDESSVRSYDVDGRLKVAATPISKAAVNPYLGKEIPGWQKLGLDPDRIYQMLRDPEELASPETIASFNELPLKIVHTATTADDHDRDVVVGTTGSNAEFSFPYLLNSLSVWDQEAINLVEAEKQKELSSAYRYDPDMTPGVWQGQKYDGVMRNIRGNHVALVEQGRAGSDVCVGDELLTARNFQEETLTMTKAVTKRAASAAMTIAYGLDPVFTRDAKTKVLTATDFLPAFDGVTAKNWKEKRGDVVAKVKKICEGRQPSDFFKKSKLAADQATPDDVIIKLVDMIAPGEAGGGKEDGLDESVSEAQHNAMGAAAGGHSNLGIPESVGKEYMEKDKGKSFDQGMTERVINVCKSNGVPPEICDKIKTELEGMGADGDDEAGNKKQGPMDPNKPAPAKTEGGIVGHHTTDEPPDFNGKPEVGKGVTKAAMDEAIKQAREEERNHQRAIYEARQHVRPYVGEIAAACDSAEEVYGHTCRTLGLAHDGITTVAGFKSLLKNQPLPGTKPDAKVRDKVAADARTTKTFQEKFPDVARIRVL